jgi:hypothetical protein
VIVHNCVYVVHNTAENIMRKPPDKKRCRFVGGVVDSVQEPDACGPLAGDHGRSPASLARGTAQRAGAAAALRTGDEAQSVAGATGVIIAEIFVEQTRCNENG